MPPLLLPSPINIRPSFQPYGRLIHFSAHKLDRNQKPSQESNRYYCFISSLQVWSCSVLSYCKILKLALFMTRNGLAPKRKLILDINLMMQRGKLLGKSLGNLMFHHHHQQQQPPSSSAATPDGHAYGPDEYEFSCSNTPIPTFVPQCAYNLRDLASGERQTPVPSPFSARVSNYSLAEDGDMLSCEVDSKAEEFIKKFYRQLHSQGRIPLQPFTDRCVNY